AFDADGAINHRRVAAKAPLPHAIAEDHRREAGLRAVVAEQGPPGFLRQEGATENRLDAERRKQPIRDPRHTHALRLCAAGQVAGPGAGISGHLLAALTLLAPLNEIRAE